MPDPGHHPSPEHHPAPADPLVRLRRLSPTPVNRMCWWIVAFASAALVFDLLFSLGPEGGGFQYIRHSVGLLMAAFLAWYYARLTRVAEGLIAEAAAQILADAAPEWADAAVLQRVQGSLPYHRLARRFVLWGMGPMLRLLRRAAERAFAAEAARTEHPPAA